MMLRLSALCIAGCCLLAAQHSSPNPGKVIPRIWPGYGELRFEVSSTNLEARKWANQGLRLVYAFNHPEAAISFRKATELDPSCAMCWWGLGFALGNNINSPLMPENAKPAYDAAQKALAFAPTATKRERAYIEALVKRYASENPKDRVPLDKAFAEAMRDLVAQFPDDLDAQTLAADSLMNLTPWKLWSRDGKPNAYTLEIVRILEGVLHRDPHHMGANHLYIHAVEASPTPERALASANILASLAPASGHLVHMPAHIFTRTGDFAMDRDGFMVNGPGYYLEGWRLLANGEPDRTTLEPFRISELVYNPVPTSRIDLAANVPFNVPQVAAVPGAAPWAPAEALTSADTSIEIETVVVFELSDSEKSNACVPTSSARGVHRNTPMPLGS